jgi:hypothetical protein
VTAELKYSGEYPGNEQEREKTVGNTVDLIIIKPCTDRQPEIALVVYTTE